MQGLSVCLASISEAGGERSKRLNIQPEVGERIGLLEDALITGDEQVHPMPNRLPGLAFSDAVIAPTTSSNSPRLQAPSTWRNCSACGCRSCSRSIRQFVFSMTVGMARRF